MSYRLIFSNVSLSWVEWFGYTVFLCGVILRICSLYTLGRFYDSGIAIQAEYRLVRNGPYRVLRHPLLLAIHLKRSEDRIHLDKFDASYKEDYRATGHLVDLFFWKKPG